ncbi:MAG TPA: hypothetical protein VGD81_12400 [Opitutaceae bacterium]
MYLTTWYEANAALAERWARKRSESEGPCFLARRGQRWSWLASLSATLGDAGSQMIRLGPQERPGVRRPAMSH